MSRFKFLGKNCRKSLKTTVFLHYLRNFVCGETTHANFGYPTNLFVGDLHELILLFVFSLNNKFLLDFAVFLNFDQFFIRRL